MTAGEPRSTRRAEIGVRRYSAASNKGVLTATRGDPRPDSLLSSLLGYRSDRPPHAATESGLPHDHAPFVADFPESGKMPAQADSSCGRHRSELRWVANSDLRFIRSDPVSSRYCSEAFFVTELYAKAYGYVSQINVDIGDHVKKGQVLAVIEEPELEAQFDKAQAVAQQAKAVLEVAKRQLAGMQADLALQQVTLKRQRELFAGKAATAQTLDETQAKERVSNANVETGKAKITSAEADLEAAKAEVQKLQALLQYDKVVAPFDGVVTKRLVNPGDLVQAATSARTGTRADPLFICEKSSTGRPVSPSMAPSPASGPRSILQRARCGSKSTCRTPTRSWCRECMLR